MKDQQFFSQQGEDRLLAEIFRSKESGVCLEVGALDGIKDSITLRFERVGWNCVLVEANPELAAEAKRNRKSRVFSCAAGSKSGRAEFVIARGAEYLSTMFPTPSHIERILNDGGVPEQTIVPVMRVDEILEDAKIEKLDFASIDVEGAELEVLKGFDLIRWCPRVILLEDNSGGQDTRVRRFLKKNGYRRFHRDLLNDWYARSDDAELLTPARRKADRLRAARARLYSISFGLLPIPVQQVIVAWKRKWLKWL